jgi:hypothetical protein
MSLARGLLFVITSFSLTLAIGCSSEPAKKSAEEKQIQKLTEEKTDLQNQLERLRAENSQLLKQEETLSKLPGQNRAEGIYHVKSLKIGSYTNIYDDDKPPGAAGKKKLVVYVEPIDETGDVIKAGGTIEVQLWDLSKKENEARLALWQVSPEELKKLWLSGIFSSGYRLSFDVAGIVDKFDRPLTVKVNFTDYLWGRQFTEQFIIKPPRPPGKKIITSPSGITHALCNHAIPPARGHICRQTIYRRAVSLRADAYQDNTVSDIR